MNNSEDGYAVPWIRTRHGRFNLDAPTFDIRDIAHALSMIARFNGHTTKFFSVAAHSMTVAWLMEAVVGGDPLEGLLHDATEAYLSDVPSPFKRQLPDWRAVDKHVDIAMREHFGLPAEKTVECKKADWLALFIEAQQLIPGGGHDFEDPMGLRGKALELLDDYQHVLRIVPAGARDDYEPCSPRRDKHAFLDLYELLLERREAETV